MMNLEDHPDGHKAPSYFVLDGQVALSARRNAKKYQSKNKPNLVMACSAQNSNPQT